MVNPNEAITTGNTSSLGNTAGGNTLDSSSPLFLHPSDGPGMSLINGVFDGRGYQGWRRSILIALSAKNKLGFINGGCSEPAATASDFSLWNRCNDMVTSWLLNSLSKDIAHSVIYSRTAKDLWTDLEQRFGQSNGAKLYHLQKEMTGLMQGSSDIAGYFTKLKRLWDELDSLNSHICCKCVCNCEGKQKMSKFVEDQRLIHFLMGLNDIFTQARGNILMLNPLPGINQAYSLLLQDENQREVYINPQFPPTNSSFMTGTYSSQQKTGNQMQKFGSQSQYSQRSGNQIQGRPGNQVPGKKFSGNTPRDHPPQRAGTVRRKKFNPNVTCYYCLKVGHIAEDCHRLIGYPDDFQFTKGFSAPIRGNATITDEEYGTEEFDGSILDQLSKSQISQIKQIFKQGNISGEGSTSSGINANAVAGPFNEEGTSFW
ncbi:hypothetical protein KY290_020928 [Solanum tuberosum]|uniref:CCHC-type domain-containing protein n=1 Tax=Solanum tuberosum TaxID=4113 RepID=A0ABQ7V350_SOLTU|nr:hypothetical protein KY289_022360 [Solanum tuberosum]KAH0757435.1 hypothetical protein KY290_020928 [Solanum tuberosum]